MRKENREELFTEEIIVKNQVIHLDTRSLRSSELATKLYKNSKTFYMNMTKPKIDIEF